MENERPKKKNVLDRRIVSHQFFLVYGRHGGDSILGISRSRMRKRPGQRTVPAVAAAAVAVAAGWASTKGRASADKRENPAAKKNQEEEEEKDDAVTPLRSRPLRAATPYPLMKQVKGKNPVEIPGKRKSQITNMHSTKRLHITTRMRMGEPRAKKNCGARKLGNRPIKTRSSPVKIR